ANVCVFTQQVGGNGISGNTSVATNANGDYTIVDLAAGTYNIQFSPTCFGSVVSAFQPGNIAVTVIEGVPTTGANVSLAGGNAIAGQVTNVAGVVLDGVCVNALVNQSVGWIATDAYGNYTI